MALENPVAGRIHPITWVRPAGNLDFKVTQTFGCTGVLAERPFGDCAHFHRAIDIGNGHCGAPVLAAKAGTVIYAGTDPATGGISVIVNHGDGSYTGYAHLATLTVAAGAKVAAGHELGTVGKTGNATACHLHFALKLELPPTLAYPYSSFWGDAHGRWTDPWPHLAQNGAQ